MTLTLNSDLEIQYQNTTHLLIVVIVVIDFVRSPLVKLSINFDLPSRSFKARLRMAIGMQTGMHIYGLHTGLQTDRHV